MRCDRSWTAAAAVVGAKLGAVLMALAASILLMVPGSAEAGQTFLVGGGPASWRGEWEAERMLAPLPGVGYEAVGDVRAVSAFLTGDAGIYAAMASAGTSRVGYAVGEAPLSVTQLDAYRRSGVTGALTQLPLAVVPLAVPVVASPAASVILDDDDLCGIFSGRFTDWSQVRNPDTGARYAAGSLTVVYRSDANGDTDLLTRHLAAVCVPSINQPVGVANSNVIFSETTSLATLFSAGVPPNFVGAAGESGMRDRLSALGGVKRAAVGYLTPAYTNRALAPMSDDATAGLAVATLRNASDGRDYGPAAAAAELAVRASNAHPPSADSAGQPELWVPGTAEPASGYPLTGTVNLVYAQCIGSRSLAAEWANALRLHFQDPAVASVLAGYGLAGVPADYVAAIDNDLLSSAAGTRADVDDPAVCQAGQAQ